MKKSLVLLGAILWLSPSSLWAKDPTCSKTPEGIQKSADTLVTTLTKLSEQRLTWLLAYDQANHGLTKQNIFKTLTANTEQIKKSIDVIATASSQELSAAKNCYSSLHEEDQEVCSANLESLSKRLSSLHKAIKQTAEERSTLAIGYSKAAYGPGAGVFAQVAYLKAVHGNIAETAAWAKQLNDQIKLLLKNSDPCFNYQGI